MTPNTAPNSLGTQPLRRKSRGRRIFGYRLGNLDDLRRYGRRLLGARDAFDGEYFHRIYRLRDPYQYGVNAYDRLKRNLARYGVHDRTFEHLLDVGSGEGFLARDLREHASRISLVDLSGAAVARARARVGRPGDDHVGEALAVLQGLPAGYCDGLVIADILYYLAPFPYSAYGHRLRAQVLRVLRPGGRLVLVHPHGWYVHAAYRRDPRLRRVRSALLKTYRSVRMEAFDRGEATAEGGCR